MSYGITAALQAAVYQALIADPAIADLVGQEIYDAVPPGNTSGTYVSLGPEDVQDASDGTGGGARHELANAVIVGVSHQHLSVGANGNAPGPSEPRRSSNAFCGSSCTNCTAGVTCLQRGHAIGGDLSDAIAKNLGYQHIATGVEGHALGPVELC